jgi:hypothetical protein
VVLDGVLTLGRADRLTDLPGAQPLEGARLQPHDVGAQIGRDVGGTGEEEVTGEDRDRVVPAGVGRGGAAAKLGLVHHVVVVERRQVGQLGHHGAGDVARGVRIAVLRGDQRQQRTEALAARVHQVARGLGDERVVARHRLAQRCLDIVETGPQLVGEVGVDVRQPERECLAHVIPSSLVVSGRTARPATPG